MTASVWSFAFALPLILFFVLWAVLYVPLAGTVSLLKQVVKRTAVRVASSRLANRIAGPDGWKGRRSYAIMLLVLTLGLVAAIGAGYLFMQLALNLGIATSAVYQVDHTVQTWVETSRQPSLTALLTAMTNVGSTIGMTSLVVVAALILFVRKQRASAVFILVTAAGGELMNLALKMIFQRARPDLAAAIASARWYSYPSGHAMASFIIFGAISYILVRQPWRWSAKSAALAFALMMIVLIGASRVYLGVHWTSDIAGAWSAGTVWLASAIVAFEMLLRLRAQRRGAPPTSAAEVVPDVPVPPHKGTS